MKYFLILIIAALALWSEQLKVVSENFQGDQQKGVSVFTGNVKVNKGHDELNASKVTIYTDKDRKPVKYVAEGDVSFYLVTEDKQYYRGKSQRAIYLPNESEYQFYTNVDLIRIDDFRRVKGDKVVVNTIHGAASAKSGNNEPVVMIFTMEDKNSTKKSGTK